MSKKYFNLNKLLGLITLQGMSNLYYGARVRLSRSLHGVNQKKLMEAIGGLIKACINNLD